MSEPISISLSPDSKERLIDLALDGLPSPHTRRAYRAALDEFLTWSQGQQPPVMCKALVHRYKAMLIEKELAPATINQRLAAVRRLAQEAADNGLLDASVASAISKVHGLRLHGVRIGIWMTAAGARELLAIPDPNSVKGKRDRAVLAVLIGCALRRSEVARVSLEQFRMVEDRWVIADLVGKHGRIRTVAVPLWAKAAVDEWCLAGSIMAGRLFRQTTKCAEVTGKALALRPSTVSADIKHPHYCRFCPQKASLGDSTRHTNTAARYVCGSRGAASGDYAMRSGPIQLADTRPSRAVSRNGSIGTAGVSGFRPDPSDHQEEFIRTVDGARYAVRLIGTHELGLGDVVQTINSLGIAVLHQERRARTIFRPREFDQLAQAR